MGFSEVFLSSLSLSLPLELVQVRYLKRTRFMTTLHLSAELLSVGTSHIHRNLRHDVMLVVCWLWQAVLAVLQLSSPFPCALASFDEVSTAVIPAGPVAVRLKLLPEFVDWKSQSSIVKTTGSTMLRGID